MQYFLFHLSGQHQWIRQTVSDDEKEKNNRSPI